MRAFYVVLITTILRSAWGTVEWGKTDKSGLKWGLEWEEVDKNIGILYAKQHQEALDEKIFESLQTTKNFFADETTKLALQSLTIGAQFIPVPFLGTLVGLMSNFAGILEQETKWKTQFAKEISDQTDKKFASYNVDTMDTFLITDRQLIKSLNKTIQGGNYDKIKGEMISTADNIHKDFLNMINGFTKPNSKFKHHPLIGSSILIALSLMVSVFEPIAIPFIAKASNLKLSCMIRDGMIDYLPFMVEDRLAKLNTNFIELTKVRNKPYNQNGYDELSYLDCTNETCRATCIKDEYSAKDLQRNVKESNCEINYALHLRHLVEKMFPIKLLQERCDQKLGDSTGN